LFVSIINSDDFAKLDALVITLNVVSSLESALCSCKIDVITLFTAFDYEGTEAV